MLAYELEALGLGTGGRSAFDCVWRDDKHEQGWRVQDLIILCISKQSVLNTILGIQFFDLSRLHSESDSLLISNSVIAWHTKSIATRYGHTHVNEAHLLLALLENYPQQFEIQFAVLKDERTRMREIPNSKAIRLLKSRLPVDSAQKLEEILRKPRNGKFDHAGIGRYLHMYLSSQYYPYDALAKSRYQADRLKERSVDSSRVFSIDALAFAAHTVNRFPRDQ